MQHNNRSSMRELLEQMPTEELDALLNSELEKDDADGNSVRMILSVLWEREMDMPVNVTPRAEKAWAKYKRNVALLDASENRKVKFRRWVLRAASTAAVLGVLILAIPREAGAEGFFDKLARLTDSIVAFFSPGLENDNLTEYVFETDNPGLQQVYDAVVELGVTDPVVPTWLPEGFELVECKIVESRKKTGVVVTCQNDSEFIILKYDVYGIDISHEYHWDGEDVQIYEHYGEEYAVMRNNDRWVVIWFTDRMECFLTLDCQEDTLYQILDSIYVTEDE